MITKEKIVKQLEESRKTEEIAVQLYCKHIKSTLFLSGFNEKNCSRIKEILNMLARESKVHDDIIEQLIEHVKNGAKDVY